MTQTRRQPFEETVFADVDPAALETIQANPWLQSLLGQLTTAKAFAQNRDAIAAGLEEAAETDRLGILTDRMALPPERRTGRPRHTPAMIAWAEFQEEAKIQDGRLATLPASITQHVATLAAEYAARIAPLTEMADQRDTLVHKTVAAAVAFSDCAQKIADLDDRMNAILKMPGAFFTLRVERLPVTGLALAKTALADWRKLIEHHTSGDAEAQTQAKAKHEAATAPLKAYGDALMVEAKRFRRTKAGQDSWALVRAATTEANNRVSSLNVNSPEMKQIVSAAETALCSFYTGAAEFGGLEIRTDLFPAWG